MSTDFNDMGRDRVPHRYFYTFIHNVYGSFFRDMMNYFLYAYPRFEWWVMGTYDKAVEYLIKGEELGSSSQIIGGQVPREPDMPMKGAIIMNPLGEFAPADANTGGKQLWRFPNLGFAFVNRLFDPIYRDEHVKITPGFQRMKGEVELIMMVESFYEYCDLRMYLYSIFGGMERVIEPQYFTSFIIIDDELLNYEYYNEHTGLRYTLDWSTAGAYEQLVKTTNRNEMAIPVTIKPQLTLTGISDASERYGGTDKLPSWKINATVSYEVELPAFLFMEIDYLAENFNVQTRYGSAYSAYNDYQPPINRELKNFSWIWDVPSTSSQTPDQLSQPLQILADDSTNVIATDVVPETTENTMAYTGDFVFKTRYMHTVTADEVDTTGVLAITIPETIEPPLILIVNSKDGELDYKNHYDIVDSGDTLNINLETVPLESDQILELFVYEAVGGTFTVTVSSDANGSTNKDGVNTVLRGTTFIITPSANSGYEFSQWTGGTTSSISPLVLSHINQNYTIQANFSKIQYDLNVSVIGDGTASPLISTYEFDTGLLIEAGANQGSYFSGWTGDVANIVNATSENTSLIVPLYSNTTLQANFEVVIDTTSEPTIGVEIRETGDVQVLLNENCESGVIYQMITNNTEMYTIRFDWTEYNAEGNGIKITNMEFSTDGVNFDSHIEDTDWTQFDNLSWDGSQWISFLGDYDTGQLIINGLWFYGYYPTYFRITWEVDIRS